MKKICVIGSCNMDLVYDTDCIPSEGETVTGKEFSEFFGGKGANQVVAMARLGANVEFIGKVGNDSYGERIKENFVKNNVIIDNLKAEDTNSGIAIICIHNQNNRIVVIPGANQRVDVEFIKSLENRILEYDIIVCQLEIPVETVEYVSNICHKNGKTFILNPTPSQKLSENLINNSDFITPNETEILKITDETDADTVLKKYPNKMILTNGKNGVKYFDGSKIVVVPSINVEAVDTTGAGDTFNGAFAFAMANDIDIYNAISFANKAAGLSVTKKGAQSGMPTLEEVKRV